MTFDWERIVAGPRGRHLCALLARDAERRAATGRPGADTPLATALFLGEVGQPGVTFITSAAGDAPAELHATEPAVLQEALAGVDVTVPDPTALPGLLQDVANAAWYWQPAPRLDTLLSEAGIVELLRPWAASLGWIEDTAWWTAPMDVHDQWFVRPRDAGHPGRWQEPVEHRLRAESDEMRAREASARAGQAVGSTAVGAGSWWSAPMAVADTTRRWPGGRPDPDAEPAVEPVSGGPAPASPAMAPGVPRLHDPVAVTVVEDALWSPEELCWQRMEVPSGVRVLEIERAEDWAQLCREHPLEVSASRGAMWRSCTGRDGGWVVPDWAAVARHGDAVHLPVAAWLELAGRPIAVDDTHAGLVAGWSPDQTAWLVDLPLTGPVLECADAR